MDEVKECTRKLLEAIRESDVCRSYTEAREKLDESPELRKTINEFRKRCYEIQNKEKSDQISQHLEQLEKDFYQVRRNEVMNHYLETELAMCRLLKLVNETLIQAADFDIDDFADTIQW